MPVVFYSSFAQTPGPTGPYSNPMYFSKSRHLQLTEAQRQEQDRATKEKQVQANKLEEKKRSWMKQHNSSNGQVQQQTLTGSFLAPNSWSFDSLVYYPNYLYTVYQ